MTILSRFMLCAFAVCLASSAAGAAAPSSASVRGPAASGGKPPANPCEVITAADVAGIFTAPAKAGDTAELTPEYKNCQYATKSAHVSVVVSQIGPDDDMAWKVATTYSHVDVPLAGIGDTAFRNATAPSWPPARATCIAASKWWVTTNP